MSQDESSQTTSNDAAISANFVAAFIIETYDSLSKIIF